MNVLEDFHQKMENLDYDASHEHLINKELQSVNEELTKEGLEEILAKSEIERQAYAIRKSFDHDEEKSGVKGLSWQMSGTATNEDGEEVPIVWPDISRFKESDFLYLEQRYKETKNLFTKTEFGLILYFKKPTPFSRHNDFKNQLCVELFELAKTYRIKAEDETKHYTNHMFRVAITALNIAMQSRFENHIEGISQWFQEIHKTWDLNRKDSLRVLLGISDIVIENFKILKNYFDLTTLIERNLQGVPVQELKYIWGAVHIIDTTFKLDQKIDLKKINYKLKRAELFEQLADEAEGTPRHLAAIDFVETALRTYKELKDETNTKRLEERYQKIRGTGKFGTVKKELDAEHVKTITESIDKEIARLSPMEILDMFSYSPMFSKIEVIQTRAEESIRTSGAMSLFSKSVVDKFGNTVAVYNTEKEKEHFAFLQAYDFSYQMGVQWLIYYFMQAIKTGKISYKDAHTFLEASWLNEPIQRRHNDGTYEVKPLDIIKPPLELFFSELTEVIKDENYDFNWNSSRE